MLDSAATTPVCLTKYAGKHRRNDSSSTYFPYWALALRARFSGQGPAIIRHTCRRAGLSYSPARHAA